MGYIFVKGMEGGKKNWPRSCFEMNHEHLQPRGRGSICRHGAGAAMQRDHIELIASENFTSLR